MNLPRPRRPTCGVLLALLMLAALEAPEASVRVLWRFAVLSWDSPATQVFDEIVCESSPPSQAGAEAQRATRLGARPSARLAPDTAAPRPGSPAPSSGITRSPPAA
jgi:hypothetical protein